MDFAAPRSLVSSAHGHVMPADMMRTLSARYRLIVFVACLLVTGAGCFDQGRSVVSSDAGVDTADDDVSAPVDLGRDDPDASIGTNDGGNVDVDVGPTCPEVCPVVPGAVVSCVEESCAYQCEPDRVDLDEDLSQPGGTGCECEVLADTDATCDGVDDDCDGEIDEDAPPQSCSAEGVCGEAVVECTDGAYPVCDEAIYAALPEWMDDEVARCDGLDNDCDGEADEGCCVAPATATPKVVGTGSFLDMSRASSSAPADAQFAVLTATPDTFSIHELTAYGDVVQEWTFDDADYPVDEIAMAQANGQYVVVTDEYQDLGFYYIRAYELEFVNGVLVVNAESTMDVAVAADSWFETPTVAASSTMICAAWAEIVKNASEARVACWAIGDDLPQIFQRPVRPGTVETSIEPIMVNTGVVDDRHILAIGGHFSTELQAISDDGMSTTAGLTASVTGVRQFEIAEIEPGVGGFFQSKTGAVSLQRFDPTDASPRDTFPIDGLGFGSRIAPVAAGESLHVVLSVSSGPYVSIGRTSRTQPATLAPVVPVIDGTGFEKVKAVVGDTTIGVVAERSSGAEFVPVSLEGVPLCP